jgi:hypothetical protein
MNNDQEEPEVPEAPLLAIGLVSLVLGLLAHGTRTAGTQLRGTLGRLDIELRSRLWMAIMPLTFAAVFTLSVVSSANLEGVFVGIFAGLLLALVAGVGGGWLLLPERLASTTSSDQDAKRVVEAAQAAELEAPLAPTLRELRAVRAEIARQVKARSLVLVPLTTAAAAGFWLLGRWDGDPETPPLLLCLFLGALVGELWALQKPWRGYTRLYKDRVLPVLVARFGDLTYRRPPHSEVRKLRSYRIVRSFDKVNRVIAEDEITGTYRGLPLSIIEVSMERGSGNSTEVLFDGLLIGLELPRSLTGTTVVAEEQDVFKQLADRWRLEGLERVRLEDPGFERRYQVYSTDPVEARALLTPAFMERFLALARWDDFDRPDARFRGHRFTGALPIGAWAEANRLVVAIPKPVRVNLFEPSGYRGQGLLRLEREIAAVLRMADAVIELDFWASSQATPVPPPISSDLSAN